MKNYYPLTAAQKMHYNWIKKYKTQQVSGVSVVASLKAALDFGLLKNAFNLNLSVMAVCVFVLQNLMKTVMSCNILYQTIQETFL